jgi:RimJ/RimL family protein N-acetyltransferase
VASGSHEPARLAQLFKSVVNALPYYNAQAKASEIAKYSAEHLQEAASVDPGSVLVARVGIEVVGFAINNLDDGTIWLSWFGVAPTYRKRQIGGSLLQALDQRARSLGIHKIWCDSRTENIESGLALAKHGFQRICTIPDHWYRQDYFLWEKRVG